MDCKVCPFFVCEYQMQGSCEQLIHGRVKVGVHQGSVLSPLLFIIVLEALSQEFRTKKPWELLYTDDLVISADPKLN